MSDDIAPGGARGHTGTDDALAVGWALHTLDPEEHAAFAEHLDGCERCRHTVDETTETLGELAFAVVASEPPPALRDRILAEATADVPRTRRSLAALRSPSPDGNAPATVVSLDERRRAPVRLLAAAVAVVVAAVGGVVIGSQFGAGDRDPAVTAQGDAVVGVLHDAGTPGVAHTTLADRQGAMVGLVVDSGTGPRVMTTGLAANASDHTYVLWGLADGAPRAIGTFDVAGTAPSVRSVPSSTGPAPYGGFAVSLEPGRTAPVSPTQIVASGQVGR